MNMSEVADFLKEKRVLAGLSQGLVAQELGYTTAQFVSNWERGLAFPPIDQIKQLAELYSTDAKEIFNVLEQAIVEREILKLKRQFKRSIGIKKNNRSAEL